METKNKCKTFAIVINDETLARHKYNEVWYLKTHYVHSCSKSDALRKFNCNSSTLFKSKHLVIEEV